MNDGEQAARRKGLASAAIFDAAARILLVKHTYGRLNWELPGGAAEAHESPVETVVRNVREETGLDIDVRSLTGRYYEPAEDLVHFVFRCEARGEDARPSPDLEEISECGHWSLDDLPRPISDFTVRRIRDAANGVGLPLPGLVGPREWLE